MQEIQEYLAEISKRYKTGISREHSYRGDLQNLLEKLLPSILVTNEPARIDCGAPDYILTQRGVPIGYIEAKDLGRPLDNTLYKEQFDRYRESLPNLIITNYLTFCFYRNGEQVAAVSIGAADDKNIQPLPDNFKPFQDLITNFAAFRGQTITSSAQLAEMMAGKARLMANVLGAALTADESHAADSTLQQQLKAFREILIPDMTPEEFAAVYAQTIAYGMFAARLHDPTPEDFSRQEAAELIPKTNPFLRKLFQYIAGYDLDPRIDWLVDALADLFRATDVAALMKNFGKTTQRNDPFLHFYETFLAAYDPKLRKSRGVWYTPEPVVNFIVRAVDDILKTEFAIKDGLADTSQTTIKIKTDKKDAHTKSEDQEMERQVHRVQILDPATGTGTFLAEVIKQIHEKFKGQQGVWNDYVNRDLIPRLHGFELLMAPYAMAHLKLEMLLTESGYQAHTATQQRLRVFLANSLEEPHPIQGIPFAAWLAQEASEANHIKRDAPVMVVLGNPPYSGHSSNKGEWIEALLKDYKQEPEGRKLQERKSKWLNDDYVKFIRYGQHFIEKNGEGVLAYINNHSFLDNPTFRGMRWRLLSAFDKIYIIDLHGNSKKKETCPDGSPDKNVFDIQQGVSINIFIKTNNTDKQKLAAVYHYDLYGTREAKYTYLWEHELETIKFNKLQLPEPLYFFMPKDFSAEEKYKEGFSVKDLFQTHGVGMTTAHDDFVIKDNKEELLSFYKKFQNSSGDADHLHKEFNVRKKTGWDILDGYKNIKYEVDLSKYIFPVSYRPFDNKYIFYEDKLVWRTARKVMQHFLEGENVGLVFKVGNAEEKSVPAMVSKHIIDFRSWSRPGMQGGDYIAPLYLYLEKVKEKNSGQYIEKKPNLDKDIVAEIAEKMGLTFTHEKEESESAFAPLDLLDYIYAVLHSPEYRDTYKEFLKIDFPRVPYPKDAKTFWQLVTLGSELRQLHLLESEKVDHFITRYPAAGDNKITRSIGKGDYKLTDHKKEIGRVWINDDQYFDGVPKSAWEFYIGGYQPAQKWLKDRKGRTLDHHDIFHYQKIIVALTETERIMQEIDQIDWMD